MKIKNMRVTTTTNNFELTDHLGNVRAVIIKNGTKAVSLTAKTDYYPFGMPMPNRNLVGDYRYKFQGQEKDPETGKEAFELRLWDGRIGRWLTADPYSQYHSPYLGMGNNPISRIDPDGGWDWVKDADGNIYWDDNVNSQADACVGCTWLGTSLTFLFNSFIDAGLWDGPGGDGPTGDKLTSYITISASENSKGQLTGISAISTSVVGETPVGTARNYYPGKGGSNNVFSYSDSSGDFSLNFEQHASVSRIEEFGLNALGYNIVDVAQKLNISVHNGNLSFSAFTNVFPSATLNVQGFRLMHYKQPSFEATHGRKMISDYPSVHLTPNPRYYPSKFFNRN